MKLIILMLGLLGMGGCGRVYNTVATCDNGFTKEAESMYIDKGTLVWGYPTSVYKIPEGVTCVLTHRRLDSESNY
jgi:uncharacterized protein YceK